MKHFTVVTFLLFCGQTLAQNKENLEFKSSEPIEANSTSLVTCKVNNFSFDPKGAQNVKVVVSANISNKILNFGEWSLTPINKTNKCK